MAFCWRPNVICKISVIMWSVNPFQTLLYEIFALHWRILQNLTWRFPCIMTPPGVLLSSWRHFFVTLKKLVLSYILPCDWNNIYKHFHFKPNSIKCEARRACDRELSRLIVLETFTRNYKCRCTIFAILTSFDCNIQLWKTWMHFWVYFYSVLCLWFMILPAKESYLIFRLK